MDEAKALDNANFAEGVAELEQEDRREKEEIEKTLLYSEVCIQRAPHAKRGDYKDGAVFQTRKAAIEEFMANALASTKRCQRKECGAYVCRQGGV